MKYLTMDNPYENYYIEQAGSGIFSFRGIRYQRGNGFFGRLIKGGLLPLLKYVGKNVFRAGKAVAKDVITGTNISDAITSNAKTLTSKVIDDTAEKINEKLKNKMKGSGRRKKRGQQTGGARKRKTSQKGRGGVQKGSGKRTKTQKGGARRNRQTGRAYKGIKYQVGGRKKGKTPL